MSEHTGCFSPIIHVDLVNSKIEVASKKRVLEYLSQRLASIDDSINETHVFEKLIERERLGSTGLGDGVAIPHARFPGVERAIIALATLSTPVDFDSSDKKPVDLILALLVPQECTDGHLKLLKWAAEMFSDQRFCDLLRSANCDNNLYELIDNWNSKNTAEA